MTATCNLTERDYRAFRRHVLFRYRKVHWFYGAMLALILALTWFGGKPEETPADKLLLLIGVAIIFGGAGLIFLLVLRVVTRFMGTRFRGTIGSHVFEITDQGVAASNADGKTETRISGIRRIDETSEHFFIITSTGVGYVLPKRDLPSLDAVRSLRGKIGRAEPGGAPNGGPTAPLGNSGVRYGPPSVT